VLEVALISVGVFLGLAGDQWRENNEHRQQARATLSRLRTEILQNRRAVDSVATYHAKALEGLRRYFEAGRQERNTADVQLQGLQPVAFGHTAWDLALATQSLAYIPPDLAAGLATIYNAQQNYADLTRGMTQALYLLPRRERFDAFAGAVEVYFDDIVLLEPRLVAMYSEIVPRIDSTIGR
jgi:hypothetical protein